MKTKIITSAVLALAMLDLAYAADTTAAPEKYHGIIELGAKGIKALVVLDNGKDANGNLLLPQKVSDYKTVNKNPYDGDAIAAVVADELNTFKKKMIAEFNLPESNIYVVESSGIPEKVRTDLQDKLSGFTPLEIKVEDEARLIFQGIVPPNRRKENEVVVLDIGSGNSKGAYLDASGVKGFQTYNIPFGTGTFAKKVNSVRDNGEDFRAKALTLAAEELLPLLRSEVRNKPGMQNCSRLYLAGGLPYVFTTLLHPELIDSRDPQNPGKKSSWVPLSAKDINEFHRIATTNPAALLKPDLSKFSGERLKTVETEIANVSKIFTQDELTAGAILIKMFMDEMYFDRKDAIFFSRDALFAWPQGYVKEILEKKLK